MPDNLTPEQRKECMSHIRSVDTKPELALRNALWHLGFRYRVNVRKLPGKPDIVLPKYHTLIFVHGCFWHGHSSCSKFVLPKSNSDYWGAKIQANIKRDQSTWRQLEAKGWSVIIVWECELKKNRLEETIKRVQTEIIHNGEMHQISLNERREAKAEYLLRRKKHKARKEILEKEIKESFSKSQ